jgi:hydroxyacylglutathione hydrolase
MYLDVFDDNPWGTNCWLLGAEGTDEAVVVDPGFEPDAVHRLLRAAERRPAAVLLTHAHLDHATQAGAFAGEEVPVFIHPADAVAFDDPDGWARGPGSPLTPAKDLRTVADGEVLRLAGLVIEVLHTPGHTPGHCCFLVREDRAVLSGDLVFAGAIGRSDFANSDPAAMRRSLERFLTLPDELPVLPGHGPRTTVGRERASNPFLAGLG